MFAEPLADGGNDFLKGFPRAGAAVPVRGAELRPERNSPGEAVERQVTIISVIAVVEPALLIAVDAVVGRVEVQHDDTALARDGLHAFLEQQAPFLGMRLDFPDATELFGAKFKPVERALPASGLPLSVVW